MSSLSDAARPIRCRLLVSVRTAEEARVALDGGVDILDVKEPVRGSLGKAADELLAAIGRLVAPLTAVQGSAALGELHAAETSPLSVFAGLDYLKFGTSRLKSSPNRREMFLDMSRKCCDRSMGRIEVIAAAYADSVRAEAPDWSEVLDWTVDSGGSVFLVDTFVKDGRGFWDWVSEAEYFRMQQRCRKANVALAVAGSLDWEGIRRFEGRTPDIFAVRGAACEGSVRTGDVSAERIQRLRDLLLDLSTREPVSS